MSMVNIFIGKSSILNHNTNNHNKYNRKIKKIQWLRRWRNAEYKPFMIMSQYTTNENVPDVVYFSFYDVAK